MIELDGSVGGGQLVRTALSLSVLTGESFRMRNVRGERSNPGLRPQHLAAVRVAADACDATVEGAEQGSESLAFRPDELTGGSVTTDVGTAGSIPLVFDTLLPFTMRLDEPLRATVRGGTDVKWAPPVDYFRRIKLALLRRYGLTASLSLVRSGFYPVGGGEVTLTMEPSELGSLSLAERGSLRAVRIYSTASASLEDRSVAGRQLEAAADRLDDAGVAPTDRVATYRRTDSPGSVIVLQFEYDGTLAGFSALGERGKPAEVVGEEAADAAVDWYRGAAVVDEHMADQLVVFLGLGGGEVCVPAITDHVETSIDLLRAFGLTVEVDDASACPTLCGSSSSFSG